MSRTLRSADALLAAGLLPPERATAARAVQSRYAIAITPHVADAIRHPSDPIGLQYLPDAAELTTLPEEAADPTADAPFSPVPGVVHRYPDRALLKPLLACPVYCRFCFRREHVGPDGGILGDDELDAALGWFAATPAIREAILTGGDPLMLSPRRLRRILEALEAIPHIELLRIHTRVPVADPSLVTDALAAALPRSKPLTICVHANHAREFGGDAPAALARLHAAGATLLGQSVLLAGVNDSEAALEDLFRTMLRHRVKPYYLHQLDPAPGTVRFRVEEARGLALIAALRGRVPGHAIPHYVVERPGGAGKVPAGG
jgi:lysine 2,3-aminomutase